MLIFLSIGNARAEGDDGTGSFFKNIGKTAEQVVKRSTPGVTKGLYAAGMGFAAKLTPMALSFGGAIALAYLMFQMIKVIGGQGGSFVDIFFDLAIPLVIAAALINSYESKMGQFNTFLDIIRNVAPDPVAGISRFYGEVLTMIEKSIKASITLMRETSIWSDSFPSKFIDVLATLIFSMVIVFIVFSGLAEILGLILMGPFLFAVGVAFGPMFVATLVVPWTRDYFGKWLGFIIGAALVTGVVGVVIGIAATCLESLNISAYATDVPISITLATSGIMIMAVNSLIAQAPTIASALIPGSIGASKGSGSAVADAAKSSGAKSTGIAKGGAGIAKDAWKRLSGSKGKAAGATPSIGSKFPS
jgi:type IV secretory pathway VirB6-like protein